MADPVTSGINRVTIGSGKDKKEIYTATKATPTTDLKGNKTYVMEVVQYDNAKGEGGQVIGIRDGKEITFNDNASDEIKGDAKAIKKINNQSSKQAKSVKNQVATTNAEKKAFKTANNEGNEGTEYENDQSVAKLKNAASDVSSSGGAGTPKPGTRNDGFPGAGGNNPLIFPQTLRRAVANGQDFLKINMMKYAPKDFSDEKFSFSERDINRETIGTVILPIPGGIQDGQSVQWGGKTMTPLDMVKADIALAGVTKGISGMVDSAGNAAQKLAEGFGPNKQALAAVIAGMASGAGDLLTRTTGAIANPNMELLFGGPSLRTFSFQFQLAPRNRDEAMEAVKIIRFFKQGMSVKTSASNVFLQSPNVFDIQYQTFNTDGALIDHPSINFIKTCALTSCDVQYTPDGTYMTYEDPFRTMTSYQLTLNFGELDPIFDDDYTDLDDNDDQVLGY